MIWKELKKGNHKNYVYYIYGKYTEHYPTVIDGKIKHNEAIETKIKIMNPLGESIHENSWYHIALYNHEETPYQYLIRFRPIYKEGFWYDLFPKVKSIIHIEDDYERVLEDWSVYAEQIINREIKDFDKERYEQEMTDGLPNSVFIKYLDR